MSVRDGVEPRVSERIHRLFGVSMRTRFRFSQQLPPGKPPAHLSLISLDGPAPSPAALGLWLAFESVRSRTTPPDGVSFYRGGERDLLRFPGIADFLLSPEQIDTFSHPSTELHWIELRLLGPVMAYWLERSGVLALHASAVAWEGRGVAFMGSHRAGKTTLAAACRAAGASLLTDDLLALSVVAGTPICQPGCPQMRVRPDLAQHAFGQEILPALFPGSDKLRAVTAGGFCGESVPLSRLYVLSRGSGDRIEIEDLPRRDAVLDLVRHSFSPRLVEAAGLQPDRLSRFAELANQVPIRHLRVPTGFHRLAEVVEKVWEDVGRRP